MFLISRPFFDFAGTIRSVAGSTQCSLEKKNRGTEPYKAILSILGVVVPLHNPYIQLI